MDIRPNQDLPKDHSFFSENRAAELVFQSDGNLVLYVRRQGERVARWASNTWHRGGDHCVMQGDGNLVIYTGGNKPIWDSKTWGHGGARLSLQGDENVVIYHQNKPIWATDTWVTPAKRCGFIPERHGFHFVNSFPDSAFKIGFFDLKSPGLCGGMCYSALDYFFAGKAVPSDTATPSTNAGLGKYIHDRQWDSVMGSWHGGKFFALSLNPDDNALKYWSTHDEWLKLKHSVDANVPLPIGLVKYMDLTNSHQVVAVGYADGHEEKQIFVYDPNHPGVERELFLAPNAKHWREIHGSNTEDWRGFFVESGYAKKGPP
jgi:hypothetical protein